jgi:hypothetical protein
MGNVRTSPGQPDSRGPSQLVSNIPTAPYCDAVTGFVAQAAAAVSQRVAEACAEGRRPVLVGSATDTLTVERPFGQVHVLAGAPEEARLL